MTKDSPEEKHQVHRRLLGRLEMQAHDVERLTRGLSEEALMRRALPDKWSLKELVCHLMIVQGVFAERAAAILRDDNPPLEPYDPDEDPGFDQLRTRPGTAILNQFLSERLRFIRLLEPLTPAEWHRGGQHPEFEHYDIHFLTEYLLYHEGHHIYQMFWQRKDFGKIPH
jgi:hypothetical protein